MAEHPGRDRLDGGWWPQSRDLAVELADLVDHFPARFGRIGRALFSPPDWDPAPRRVQVAGGYVKVGSFPRDDSHLIQLKTSDRTVLHVLVVPPGFTESQGAEALLAATTRGSTTRRPPFSTRSPTSTRSTPMDSWNDDGESWWGPSDVAPSFRTGR